MLIKERKLVAPTVYLETRAFWDAAGEGRLLVKQCDDCGEHHHYPRAACPFCAQRTHPMASGRKRSINGALELRAHA